MSGIVPMKKYGPLDKSHALIGQICPACDKMFIENDLVTLIPIGPGDDPEEQAKCYAGKVYTAVALTTHWSCATGDPQPMKNMIILEPGSGGMPFGSQ